MNKIKKFVKARIKGVIELMPMGRDVFLILTQGRNGICYRGVYDSAEQARVDGKSNLSHEYDEINKTKSYEEQLELSRSGFPEWFQDTDYPLLYWFTQAIEQNSRVLELGGSIGHFFYYLNKFSSCPEGISWTIAELPEAVKLGEKISLARGETRLKFIDSANIRETSACDIFLTAGTLQYIDTTLPEILSMWNHSPKHVLVHTLPVHKTRALWTLQNLGTSEVPYQVFSLEEIESGMEKRGYSLISSWRSPRSIEIPFHREFVIEGYMGFYFRKRSAK